jgi:endonuclease YncB( thermonuclease family)
MWRNILVVVLILAAYWYQEKYLGGGGTAPRVEPEIATSEPPAPPRSEPQQPPVAPKATPSPANNGKPTALPPAPKTAPPKPVAASNATVTKVKGYDRLEGCRLVDHRDNDGDSFHVRHGNREFELRLYYVDTPEKYLSDRYEDQRRRVAEQGRDFGGLSPEQTVEIGKAAKLYTARLLEGRDFTVYTKWESVYNSERVYAFVELPGGDEFLSEELVEKGLGRIHTKGESTPKGQSYRQFKSHLESLERAAQEAGRGAWGLN